MMIRSEIGQIIYQLKVKKNPLVKLLNKKLKKLLSETHQCQVILEPRTAEPAPIPLEVELGLETKEDFANLIIVLKSRSRRGLL